jgi:YesN/AraC family two-component response regulator
MSYIYFNSPPSPYYLESGISDFHSGDSHPNRHNLNLFDLIIVRRGSLHLGEEQESWVLNEGQTLILLPNCYHYSVEPVTTDTYFYWIHFQTVNDWMESEQSHYKFPTESHQDCFNPAPYTMQIPKSMQLLYPQQVYQLVEQMNEASKQIEPKAYWQKQHAFEELLLMMDVKQNNSQTSSIVRLAEQVEHYIRNHYQGQITNQALSLIFNYHYNYITKAMKQVYGFTPNEYVMKVRLDQAKILLLNTYQSIASIAEAVGFDNIPYFSNCFVKHVGETPSSFRKKYYE